MKFNVYGYANPTKALFNQFKKEGHIVNIRGEQFVKGTYHIKKTLKSVNIKNNLKNDCYHFFTRFDGNIELINAVLKNNKHNGLLIAHISYGYPTFKKILEGLNFKNFDYILCCNKDYVTELKKIGIQSYYLPNTIDSEKIKLRRVNEEYKYACLVYNLMYSYAKNYTNLILFFKSLVDKDSNYRLTIKVPSTKIPAHIEEENRVKRTIKSLDIKDKVVLRNEPINTNQEWREAYRDANELFKNHSIYISYSRWESFGYAIAEALLAGKGVFVKGWKRRLNPEQFWEPYVCKSEKDMKNRIIEYTHLSKKEKEEIAKQNRKFVVDRYSPSTAVNILKDILGA